MKPIFIGKAAKVCANCTHYAQHFLQYQRPSKDPWGEPSRKTEYWATHFGHCTTPQAEQKTALDTCKRFKMEG